jgi:hypothetical protein
VSCPATHPYCPLCEHQAGEALSQRVGRLIELCAEGVFRNLLDVETMAADCFESPYDLERAKRLGSAELDRSALGARMP